MFVNVLSGRVSKRSSHIYFRPYFIKKTKYNNVEFDFMV